MCQDVLMEYIGLMCKNDWLREFFQLYKERVRLPFTGNFRFGAIQEEDIKLLAEAGATGLIFALKPVTKRSGAGC
jgi:hypothetical protein